jgi:hypothetical protein
MPMPRPDVGGACEAARLRASLALDGGLDDDFDLLLLERHLARCPECAEVIAGMRRAAGAVRRAPLLAHRCEVGSRRTRALPWANIAVTVLTIAAAGVVLPQASDRGRPGEPPPRLAAPPPRLPIGQRSAVEDFVPGITAPAAKPDASA